MFLEELVVAIFVRFLFVVCRDCLDIRIVLLGRGLIWVFLPRLIMLKRMLVLDLVLLFLFFSLIV